MGGMTPSEPIRAVTGIRHAAAQTRRCITSTPAPLVGLYVLQLQTTTSSRISAARLRNNLATVHPDHSPCLTQTRQCMPRGPSRCRVLPSRHPARYTHAPGSQLRAHRPTGTAAYNCLRRRPVSQRRSTSRVQERHRNARSNPANGIRRRNSCSFIGRRGKQNPAYPLSTP